MKNLLIALILTVLAGCAPQTRSLTYVIIPAEEAVKSQGQFEPFVEYLSGRLGREVELMVVSDYAAVVEAMKYGHADIARFGPFNYVLAMQEADIEVLVAGIKENTMGPSYHALIIARADRGVTDLEGKSFAFSDVGSASGYLAPMTYLQENGIQPGEIFFSGSHSASIEAVRNGTVDVAALADNRYLEALKEGVINIGEFVILWESSPIPNSPIAVQKSMDPNLKAQILGAFLEAPREIVEGLGIGEVDYVRIQDSDYDIIRQMQETQERLAGD